MFVRVKFGIFLIDFCSRRVSIQQVKSWTFLLCYYDEVLESESEKFSTEEKLSRRYKFSFDQNASFLQVNFGRIFIPFTLKNIL